MRTDSAGRPSSLFQVGPASEDYALIRDHPDPDIAATRAQVESLWEAFAPHADATFLSDAMVNFRARFWELYLFSVLGSFGLNPRGQPSGGPDLLLDTPGGRASLEATAVTVGEGRDRVPEVEYSEIVDLPNGEPLLRAKVVEMPNRELLLRLTAAMDEKCRKATQYLQKGLLRANEPFAIAINGAVNSYAMSDCRTPDGFRVPRIIQVLYGVGPYAMSINEQGKVQSEGFQARPSVPKLSGAEVPGALFRSDAHAYVSCVLFGLEYARSFDFSGRNLLLVHNPFARSPWPRGLLKRGVEYWVEGTTLRWTDWHRDETELVSAASPEVRS